MAGDCIGYSASVLPQKIHNTNKDTFRCIVLEQRLDHDGADYFKLAKRLYRNKSQNGTWWILIMLNNQMQVNNHKKRRQRTGVIPVLVVTPSLY